MMRTLLVLAVLSPALVACDDDDSAAAEQTVAPAEAPSGDPPETERPYDEDADANVDIERAVAAAGASNKHVLLMFGGNWCVWCRRLDHVFANNPAVRTELSANYELVHVDTGARNTGKNSDINDRYGDPTQHGFPVLVVLDGQGEQVTTQETGSLEDGPRHDPDKVLAFLRRARGG